MDGTLQDTAGTENGGVAIDSPAIEEAAREYLGRWNRLISSTNWEKGRIISQWREALIEAAHRRPAIPTRHGAARRAMSRPSTLAGCGASINVSSPRGIRIRASIGATSKPRWIGTTPKCGSKARCKTVGRSRRCKTSDRKPWALVQEQVEAEAIELDEDAADVPPDRPPEGTAASAADAGAAAAAVEDDVAIDAVGDGDSDSNDFADAAGSFEQEPVAPRPFENLPHLPADLREAFDSFKLAIVHHRIARWQEASLEDVLATLDALRQLALAPADAEA